MSDLATELKAIREKHGKLNPRLVLEEARDPDHPLHSRFEWDDHEAAESFRLLQARELISVVRLKFTDTEGKERSIRQFYAIRAADSDEYDYDSVEDAMRDVFRRKLLLNEMKRRVDELVSQYEALGEFWEYLRGIRRRRKAQ